MYTENNFAQIKIFRQCQKLTEVKFDSIQTHLDKHRTLENIGLFAHPNLRVTLRINNI